MTATAKRYKHMPAREGGICHLIPLRNKQLSTNAWVAENHDNYSAWVPIIKELQHGNNVEVDGCVPVVKNKKRIINGDSPVKLVQEQAVDPIAELEQQIFEKELSNTDPVLLQDYITATAKEQWSEQETYNKLREAVLA